MSRMGKLKMTVNESGTAGYSYVPGFASIREEYETQTWKLTKNQLLTKPLWKAIHGLWLKKGRFMHDAQFDEHGHHEALNFIKFLHVEYSPDYIQAYEQFLSMNKDVTMAGEANVVHLGNTSSSVRNKLHNATTGAQYATFELVYVHVDKATRKASPYPEHFRKKYVIREQEPVKVVNVDTVPIDSQLVWDTVTIVEYMIDFNDHTMIEHYQDFASDALEKALKQGHFQGYENIKEIPIKSIGLAFQGESRLGDVLYIGMWQHVNQRNVFYCVIKKGERVLVKVEMKLFDKLPVVQSAHL